MTSKLKVDTTSKHYGSNDATYMGFVLCAVVLDELKSTSMTIDNALGTQRRKMRQS
jgi:hypothetical protein